MDSKNTRNNEPLNSRYSKDANNDQTDFISNPKEYEFSAPLQTNEDLTETNSKLSPTARYQPNSNPSSITGNQRVKFSDRSSRNSNIPVIDNSENSPLLESQQPVERPGGASEKFRIKIVKQEDLVPISAAGSNMTENDYFLDKEGHLKMSPREKEPTKSLSRESSGRK
jgi:hypothetical protein